MRALAILLAACATPAEPPPPIRTPEPEVAAPSVDARDQYALLDAMIAAEAHDPAEQNAAYAAVRADWTGRRVRWSMMRVGGLCRTPSSCNFAPFDLARDERASGMSFLPRASMPEREHAAMQRACEGQDACLVTIEATLSELHFDLDEATRIALADGHFVSARALRGGEHYLSRPPVQLPEGSVPGAVSGPWARAIEAAQRRRAEQRR